MAAAIALKICVVGPCRAGKTLLCSALAEQPLLPDAGYQPTVALRVQEVGAAVGPAQEPVRAQLWDVSGSSSYKRHWAALAEDIDGVLLVVDPARADEGERELEALYLAFAQPAGLTTRQCMVLAVDTASGAVGGAAAWRGLKGKLGRLQSACVALSAAAPEAGAQDARRHLQKLLAGCLARKKDQVQRAVLGDDGGDDGQEQ